MAARVHLVGAVIVSCFQNQSSALGATYVFRPVPLVALTINMALVFLLLTWQGRNTHAISASRVLVTGLDNKLNLVQRMGRRDHTYNPTMKDKVPFAMSVSLFPSWVQS